MHRTMLLGDRTDESNRVIESIGIEVSSPYSTVASDSVADDLKPIQATTMI